MSQTATRLSDNVARQDHLHFTRPSGEIDYKGAAAFLDFDKKDLTRIADVKQASARI